MSHAWDRKEGEPDRQWAGFQYYRDHSRSIARVYVQNLRVPTAEVKEWFDTWSWRDRCLAHDKFLEDIRQEEKEIQAREAVAQADRTRALARELAEVELEKTLALAREVGHTVMTGNALVRIFEASQKAENLAQGKPTEIQSAKVDLSKVSTADLASLLAELEEK